MEPPPDSKSDNIRKFKILALADIHVEINEVAYGKSFLDDLGEMLGQIPDVDLVVCAGDVSPVVPELQRTLNHLVESIDANYYIFVPGNHDIWEICSQKLREGISKEKYEQTIPEIVNQTKFHYLPNQPLILDDDLAIIGNIAWYDYSFRDPKWDEQLRQKKTWYYAKRINHRVWNDVNYAEWGMYDVDVTHYLIAQLKEDYQKIRDIPYKAAVVHHVPFRKGVVYRDVLEWDFFSAFMGAAGFGDLFQQWNFDLIIYGHTHFPQTYHVGSCRAICAPIGYAHEWKFRDLFEELPTRVMVFEIP